MLSEETAVGRYPVETVETMVRIVEAAEEGDSGKITDVPARFPVSFPLAACAAGARAATETAAKVIVVFTETGMTARLLSTEQPTVPIIAYTPHEAVRRRMALYKGVVPRSMRRISNTDELIRELERSLRDEKFAQTGDRIVVLLGAKTGTSGSTSLIKLHTIG
jgi:pyruvate kinase